MHSSCAGHFKDNAVRIKMHLMNIIALFRNLSACVVLYVCVCVCMKFCCHFVSSFTRVLFTWESVCVLSLYLYPAVIIASILYCSSLMIVTIVARVVKAGFCYLIALYKNLRSIKNDSCIFSFFHKELLEYHREKMTVATIKKATNKQCNTTSSEFYVQLTSMCVSVRMRVRSYVCAIPFTWHVLCTVINKFFLLLSCCSEILL